MQSSMIKELDFYGEEIKLTYKGDDKYKTYPGAFVSLLLIFILSAYAIYRGVILINKMNPEVSKKSFLRDLNLAGEFHPADSGFNFAFQTTKPIDTSIAYFTVKLIDYYYTDKILANGARERLKTKTDLPFSICGEKFQYYN